MTEALIAAAAAVVVGILSLVGVMITNSRANNRMQSEMKTTQAVTEERIEELTREVRTLNSVVYELPVLKEQLKSIKRRIEELEKYHKPSRGG